MIVVLFTAMLVLFPVAVFAQASAQGTIEGQVVNKTPNGKGVADISVELKTLQQGQDKGSVTTRTDSQGRFRFAGLSTEPAYIYGVTLNYQEADYDSGDMSFKAGETAKNVEIAVWDATDSGQGIKIGTSHVVVQFEGDGLKVTEYYRVENPGDKTYVGSKVVSSLGKKETLRFVLPPGAQVQHLALGLKECCVSLENGALVDTMGITPGIREVAFVYATTFSSPRHVLPIVAPLPIDGLDVVVEDKGIQVSSSRLSPPQSMNIENLQVLVMSARKIERGERVETVLTGLPTAGLASSLRWLGIGLMAAALAFGVAYPLLRRRHATVAVSAQGERYRLLEEVAKLDDSFEAGQIGQDEYDRLRSTKMARLMALSRRKL